MVYLDRGDSGALIVGAAFPTNQQPMGTTTYGGRVTLQGWGEGVATLGHTGDLFTGDGSINRTYTDTYNGTSSATPIVTAAVILTQQAAKEEFGTPLDAREIRQLVRATGTPEQVNPAFPFIHIGPLPNLQNALSRLDEADAKVTAIAGPDNAFRVEVENLGPSRVHDRTLNILLTRNTQCSTHLIGESAELCAPVDFPSGVDCAGFCAAYSCEVPEVRYNRDPLTLSPLNDPFELQWVCEETQLSAAPLNVSAWIDAGGQVDPVANNNQATVQSGSCSPSY